MSDHELMNNPQFWHKLDTLIYSGELVIDMPKGTPHFYYKNLIYPVDYGYISGTAGQDKDGIDCYRGTLPGYTVTALVVTADILNKDCVAKLLIGCTEEEIVTIMKFINSTEFQKAILIRRP